MKSWKAGEKREEEARKERREEEREGSVTYVSGKKRSLSFRLRRREEGFLSLSSERAGLSLQKRTQRGQPKIGVRMLK